MTLKPRLVSSEAARLVRSGPLEPSRIMTCTRDGLTVGGRLAAGDGLAVGLVVLAVPTGGPDGRGVPDGCPPLPAGLWCRPGLPTTGGSAVSCAIAQNTALACG